MKIYDDVFLGYTTRREPIVTTRNVEAFSEVSLGCFRLNEHMLVQSYWCQTTTLRVDGSFCYGVRYLAQAVLHTFQKYHEDRENGGLSSSSRVRAKVRQRSSTDFSG